MYNSDRLIGLSIAEGHFFVNLLYNKIGHFTAGCFMTMPFPCSVIQDDNKFNAF
jgi:hypothetical protein